MTTPAAPGAAVAKRKSDNGLKSHRTESDKIGAGAARPRESAATERPTESARKGDKAGRQGDKIIRPGVETTLLLGTGSVQRGVKVDRHSVATDHQSVIIDRPSGKIGRQNVQTDRPKGTGAIGRDRLTAGVKRLTGADRPKGRSVQTPRKAAWTLRRRRVNCKK